MCWLWYIFKKNQRQEKIVKDENDARRLSLLLQKEININDILCQKCRLSAHKSYNSGINWAKEMKINSDTQRSGSVPFFTENFFNTSYCFCTFLIILSLIFTLHRPIFFSNHALKFQPTKELSIFSNIVFASPSLLRVSLYMPDFHFFWLAPLKIFFQNIY